MKMSILGAVIITGALLASGTTPVLAASPMTNVFLNNLIPNVDFLDQSSRFALTNSKAARLKDYAHSTAKEQTLAANAVDVWVEADKRPVLADASADAPLQTGRSVAVGGQGAQLVDNRLPMGQEDLDLLEGLTGGEFDSAFKAKQIDALTQITTDYRDYIAKGDDPQLLAIANRELPKAQRRLALLRKL